jgi:hypothetical protein
VTEQPQDAQEAPEISEPDRVAHRPDFPTVDQAAEAERKGDPQ